MKNTVSILSLLVIFFLVSSCNNSSNVSEAGIPVIFDTDANNELDDQHALAYLLLNDQSFNILGITTNATYNGGEIDEHMKEAQRVVDLVGWKDKVRVIKGANGDFEEIRAQLKQEEFDGSEAVDFIIQEAMKKRKEKLVLLPVGKLTNVALALEKEPAIAKKIRIVWLGANYPAPGEYNLDNDIASMNYILKTDVPFEMVTVRYGETSGTAYVMAKRRNIYARMPGMGPVVDEAVTGRHGGAFTCFGDYSVDLFRNITSLENGCFRSLFDMAAVAIVKDPSWAEAYEIPSPLYLNNEWVEQGGNSRVITVWENFNRDAIMTDFYSTLENASAAEAAVE
ncbi:MAG: nucleoside hydrolase [Bacteroidetes bacterium]|nr:MAG: nucleoside hydrolase [Bacteroidota bacterium]